MHESEATMERLRWSCSSFSVEPLVTSSTVSHTEQMRRSMHLLGSTLKKVSLSCTPAKEIRRLLKDSKESVLCTECFTIIHSRSVAV